MNNSQSTRHWRAIGMLVLATAFWGISFPTIKALAMIQEALQPGESHWFITAATVGPRFVVATLVMLVVRFFSRSQGPTTWLE